MLGFSLANILMSIMLAEPALDHSELDDESTPIEIPPSYIAQYTSAFSPTGAFTLYAQRSGDGQTLMLADIIPMEQTTIVAQRHLQLPSLELKFGAGPFFAWGPEFVVTVVSDQSHSWSRVPLSGDDATTFSGPLTEDGFYSDMFSPFLATQLPREVGDSFTALMPYPRSDETVSIEEDSYTIVAREHLALSDTLGCHCWKIEKTGWDGSVEHIWVDRQAPFVFRRVRDPGGPREFTSDLLSFQLLQSGT